MIVLEAVVDLFFPGDCVVCGNGYGEEGAGGLCNPCRHRLDRELYGESVCSRCGRPVFVSRHTTRPLPESSSVTASALVCRICRASSPVFRRLVVLGPYGGALEAVIKAGKFAERLEPVACLADLLADRLRGGGTGRNPAAYDFVVALPSDHTFGVALADAVATKLGAERRDPLTRLPGARRQGGLTRKERLANAVVMLTRREGIAGQSVLIVDDVVTTGATLEAATRLLESGGVLTVDAAVVARTPIGR